MTRTVGIQKMAGHISGTGYGSIAALPHRLVRKSPMNTMTRTVGIQKDGGPYLRHRIRIDALSPPCPKVTHEHHRPHRRHPKMAGHISGTDTIDRARPPPCPKVTHEHTMTPPSASKRWRAISPAPDTDRSCARSPPCPKVTHEHHDPHRRHPKMAGHISGTGYGSIVRAPHRLVRKSPMNTMTRTVGIQKMAGHISGTGYGSIVRPHRLVRKSPMNTMTRTVGIQKMAGRIPAADTAPRCPHLIPSGIQDVGPYPADTDRSCAPSPLSGKSPMNTMTRTVGIQKMAGHISGTGYDRSCAPSLRCPESRHDHPDPHRRSRGRRLRRPA